MQNGSRSCLENLDITRIFGCEKRGFYLNVEGYKVALETTIPMFESSFYLNVEGYKGHQRRTGMSHYNLFYLNVVGY
ncbi:hypothetical protein D3C74_69690 [compost metagenome]